MIDPADMTTDERRAEAWRLGVWHLSWGTSRSDLIALIRCAQADHDLCPHAFCRTDHPQIHPEEPPYQRDWPEEYRPKEQRS